MKIKFTGRDVWDKKKRKIEKVVDPVTAFMFEGRQVKLPSIEIQRSQRIFEHKDGLAIVRSFPHLYKQVK